jgi:hypothetical protein
MVLFSVLALPNPETTITIQPQSKKGLYGTNSLAGVKNEIVEQSNDFYQNLQAKNQSNLQQAIDKLILDLHISDEVPECLFIERESYAKCYSGD